MIGVVDVVLLVMRTAWDRKQLEERRPAWASGYEIVPVGPDDADCPWDFDPVAFVEREARAWRGRAAGVLSTSDYPGTPLASALATALGLPATPPEAIIRASHKWTSRQAQARAAPEAVPPFDLLDPDDPRPRLPFPMFVKPVKGAFSVLARRVDDEAELRRHLAQPAVGEFREITLAIWNRLVAHPALLEVAGDWFIAEGLLSGDQVTVEGWVQDGKVAFLGVVDSVLHPEGSFARFDYPSRLPAAVQARMEDVARRVVLGLGLRDTLFNVEMMHDPATGAVGVIEINPRACGQFADLYEKVDGINGYEVALAVATGRVPPARRRQGAFAAAASVPLRVFGARRVEAAPDEAGVRAAEELHPGALAWTEYRAGQELADLDLVEDGRSFRYAVINVGGRDGEDVVRRAAEVESALGFRFS